MKAREESQLITLGLSQPKPTGLEGSQSAKRHKDWDLVVFGSVVICACLLFALNQYLQLDLFHASPGCVSGYQTDPKLSPCTWVSMRLAAKRTTDSYRNRGRLFLDLTDPYSRMQYSIELKGGLDLFRLTREGDLVQAKFWRGSVVELTDQGFTSVTMDYPGSIRLAILGIVIWGPLLVVALFRALRR